MSLRNVQIIYYLVNSKQRLAGLYTVYNGIFHAFPGCNKNTILSPRNFLIHIFFKFYKDKITYVQTITTWYLNCKSTNRFLETYIRFVIYIKRYKSSCDCYLFPQNKPYVEHFIQKRKQTDKVRILSSIPKHHEDRRRFPTSAEVQGERESTYSRGKRTSAEY